MKIRPGDKFTLEFEVVRPSEVSNSFMVSGAGQELYFSLEEIEKFAKNYVSAPVTPAVGQVWRNKVLGEWTYKIIFLDDKTVLWEYVTAPKHGQSYVGRRFAGAASYVERNFKYVEG